MTAHAAPLDELYARHQSGGTLISNRYPDLEPGCRAYGVHRGVLFQTLYALVNARPVEARLDSLTVGRERAAGGDGLTETAGRRHGPFEVVVLATAPARACGRVFGFRARVHRYAHGTLWVTAPGVTVHGRLLQVVRGCRQLLGLLPLGNGLCSLYWGLPVADFERTRARGLGPLKDESLVS